MWTWKCRNSDAMVIQTDSISPNDVGYIARTTSTNDGSIALMSARLTITGTSYMFVGEQVYKVGRTTGTTSGPIRETCVSFEFTWDGRWHRVTCADGGGHDSDEGDSGGPVFKWNGTWDRVTW